MVPPKKRQLNWTQLHILKHSQAMFCRDPKGELRRWCQSSWGLQAAYATFLIMSLVPTATVKLNSIMIPIVALPSFCLTTISDIVSVFVHLIPCSLQWPQVFDPPISPDFSQWAQLCHIKLSEFQRVRFFFYDGHVRTSHIIYDLSLIVFPFDFPMLHQSGSHLRWEVGCESQWQQPRRPA